MGGEFGQRREWQHDAALEWFVLQHAGAPRRSRPGCATSIATTARRRRCISATSIPPVSPGSTPTTRRTASSAFCAFPSGDGRTVLVVCNFTPVPRHNYVLGVPAGGFWREVLNSDAAVYGGSGMGNFGGVQAAPLPSHGRSYSLTLSLPPLATVVLEQRAVTAAAPPTAAAASSSRTCRRASIDGRFAAKRCAGDLVEVEADIFADGHDRLRAVLLARKRGAAAWIEFEMTALGQRPLARGVLPFRTSAATNTRSSPGSTASRRGATTCNAGSHPRTSPSRCRAAPGLIAALARRARGADAKALREWARVIGGADPLDARRAAALDAALAEIAARHADRSLATTLEPALQPDRRSAAGAVQQLVRDVSALRRRRPCVRDLRRLRSAAPVHRRHGIRRALFSADPSDRTDAAQGQEQRAGRVARRLREPMGDRQLRRRPYGRAPRARHDRGLPAVARCRARRRHRHRPRHRAAVLAGPSLHQRRIRSGSGSGPTAPCSSPRIRRRNTRTSIRSISRTRTGAACGARSRRYSTTGSQRACASSGSTIRTPSRSRCGSG